MGPNVVGRILRSERGCPCGGILKSGITVAGFRVAELEFPARRRSPRHAHADARLSILLRGYYREHWEAGDSDCAPGATILQPAGAKHSLEFAAIRSRMIAVTISREAAKRLEEFGLRLETPRQINSGLLAAIGHRLSAALGQNDEPRALLVEGLVLELFGELLLSPKPERTAASIRTALALIHDRFRESISLSAIADEVGVSPMHLSRQFRSMTGMTVGSYIRKLRIETACQRLMNSPISLAELAAELGFVDQSHLSHTFKRITGISPAAFRRAHRH